MTLIDVYSICMFIIIAISGSRVLQDEEEITLRSRHCLCTAVSRGVLFPGCGEELGLVFSCRLS